MCRRYRGAKQPCEKRAQAIVRTSHLCPLPKKPAYMSHSTGRPQQPVGASAEKTRNRFRPVDRTIPGAKSNPSTRPASAPRPNGLGPNDLERDLLGYVLQTNQCWRNAGKHSQEEGDCDAKE